MPDELHRRGRPRTLPTMAALVAILLVIAWMPWQGGAVTRTALLRAEDARGDGPDGLKPLIDGLAVPALRTIAIRGIGRQERPELVAHIIPYLSDESLTATVADAMAQSLAGLPPDSSRTTAQRELVDTVFRLLRDRASADTSVVNRAALARSIGRLPYGEAGQARAADSVLISMVKPSLEKPQEFSVVSGMAQGLYTLARSRRTLGALSPAAVAWLRSVLTFGLDVANTPVIRRTAWLALTANGAVDHRDVRGTISEDPDPQSVRLAVAAMPNVPDSAFWREQLARVADNPPPMVRLEWVRVYRLLLGATDCRPLLQALGDSVHHVRLAAIDALGGSCPQRDAVVAALTRIIEVGASQPMARAATGVSWHAKAHALAALARADSTTAAPLLKRESRHPVWQVRMYVARGALAMRDSMLLSTLARDSVGNVREAAIQGLSTIAGHAFDSVYARALASSDYHVVLAAARALRGTSAPALARPAVVAALLRISREQRQTSRDPRMELLARLRDIGDRESAAVLPRLLTDVDPVVATEAASVYTHLTRNPPPRVAGRRGSKLVMPPSGTIRLRVTMSPSTGGGTFEVLLDADVAPMSAARVIDLVRRRYYDGLTFHRVVPNFVLQGGSPGMNEYVGDGPFMRDELGLAHHARGTVGISTRGRDTGDAQWFINLVDNFRLDHEYTVLGTIVRGMDVVDRILEGDVIASVRVVP